MSKSVRNFKKPLSDSWVKCVCAGCGKVRFYPKSQEQAKLEEYFCSSCVRKRRSKNKT